MTKRKKPKSGPRGTADLPKWRRQLKGHYSHKSRKEREAKKKPA